MERHYTGLEFIEGFSLLAGALWLVGALLVGGLVIIGNGRVGPAMVDTSAAPAAESAAIEESTPQ